MPGVPPPPRSDLPPPPPPLPCCGPGVGKEKKAPASAREEPGARPRPAGLTSAAKRVLAERAGGRPQQGQRGPGERAGGRAAGSHPGPPGPRLGPRTFHPSRQPWGRRGARRLGFRDGPWARPGVGACGAPRAPRTVGGSDSPDRCPSSRRARDALGRALFLARAALPVGQTEPVNSAAGDGPAPGAPRNGSRSSAES